MNNKRCRREGFTLIELVCVLAILAILLMAAAPELASYRKGAQTAAKKREAAELADAVQRYLNDQREAGGVGPEALHRLIGLELNDEGGPLGAYITVNRAAARIATVNVDMEEARLEELLYETGDGSVRVLMNRDGTKTVEEQ